jgi:glycosyltransferase involved in cell wall biosynthesis
MKKTILFVSHGAYFFGAERVLYDIIKNLRHKYFIHVLVPGQGILTDKLSALEGITFYSFHMPKLTKKPVGLLKYFFALLPFCIHFMALINTIRPDLIYNNTTPSHLPPLLAKVQGVPCIWHIHERSKEGIAGKIYGSLVNRYPQRIVFISCFVQSTFASAYPGILDRSRVVYNGIEPDSEPVSAVGLKDKYRLGFPVICTIAQLSPQKRLGDIILAMSSVVKLYPQARLLIVGEGEQRPELEALISENGLSDLVHLLGYVPDVRPVLVAADIVVCPFEGEGFGLSVVEAMAVKKPVVASASGGFLEIIEDGRSGLFFPVGDIELLVEKIKELIESESKRLDVGQAGYRRVTEQFSIGRQMRDITGLIDNMISGD